MFFGLITFTTICWGLLAVGITLIVRWAPRFMQGASPSDSKAGPKGSAQRPQASASSANGAGGPLPDEDVDEEGEGTAGSSFTEGVRLRVVQVAGATGEISRILQSRDYYAVLDVPRAAEGTDIKKAYRSKQMATHPDKNHGAPGAHEASQRVNAAHETLSDDIRRRQYDVLLTDEEQYGPRSQRRGQGKADFADLAKAFDELVRKTMPPPPPDAHYPTIDPSAYDTWGDSPIHTFRMACPCSYDHMATKVPSRSSTRARRCSCSRCGVMGRWLPARDNDVWFETSSSFLKAISPERFIRAYRCVGLCVYDITPWARCNGMIVDGRGSGAPTNTHSVPFRLLGSSNARGAQQRSEKKEKTMDANYGYNQFKGKGVNSHKTNKKKRK